MYLQEPQTTRLGECFLCWHKQSLESHKISATPANELGQFTGAFQADKELHSLCLTLTRAALTRWIGFVCARVAWISTIRATLATCVDEVRIRPAIRRVGPPKALAGFEQVDDAGGGGPVVVMIGANPERRAALRAGLVVPAVEVKPEISAGVKQRLAHVASQLLGRVPGWLVTTIDCTLVSRIDQNRVVKQRRRNTAMRARLTLYVVDFPLLKSRSVLRIVAIAACERVVTPFGADIGVQSEFEAHGVQLGDERRHPLREARWVADDLVCFRVALSPAIVEVDVVVADGLEPRALDRRRDVEDLL